jgi:hypothetical protein
MIGLLNVDITLTDELSKSVKTINVNESLDDNVKALFIDWLPTTDDNKENAQKLIKQVGIIKHYIKKKIPIMLFDRYRGLTNTEIDWFKKNNVKFFEPCIHLRPGFQYLPYWIKIKTFDDLILDNHEREITLLYKGNLTKDKIETFREYYVDTAKENPSYRICYHSGYKIDPDVELYYKSLISPTKQDYINSKFTILIGTQNDYRDGYLDSHFFDALNNGCIPLLPIEHRYYGSLKSLIVYPKIIRWYTEIDYKNVYLGYINDVYREIERFYPEMNIKNVTKIIKENI